MQPTPAKDVKSIGIGPWGSPADLAQAVNEALVLHAAQDRMHHAVVLDISYFYGQVSLGSGKPQVPGFYALITLKVP